MRPLPGQRGPVFTLVSSCSPELECPLHCFLNFIYLFLAALGLGCCSCTQAFSGCGVEGLLSSCGARAFHCDGFSCCEAWALGA